MDKHIAHWLFTGVITTLGAILGFMVSLVFGDIEKLTTANSDLPLNYVLKADYRDDQADLMATLNGIRVDLKHNAEYIEADYNRRMDKLEELLNKSLHSHENK